jgi:hypothetical protein
MSVFYVASYDYEGTSETELSFRSGERIEITFAEGDWWYGKAERGEGWIAPAFLDTGNPIYPDAQNASLAAEASVEEVRPAPVVNNVKKPENTDPAPIAVSVAAAAPELHLSPDEMRASRNILLDQIIEQESNFVKTLEYFAACVFEPLSIRDDQFKRNFMADPSLGLCVSLLAEQLKFICSTFYNSLLSAKKNGDVRGLAAAYSQFAPSLQVFAQYTSENTNALSNLKMIGQPLTDFLTAHPMPPGYTLEQFFLLPVQHYTEYLSGFQKYVLLTPEGDDGYDVLNEALDLIAGFSLEVDERLKQENERIILLAIQSKCKCCSN